MANALNPSQGLVRFIGVTGHGSQIAATHLRSLERFDFDTVLLPYSYIMMQDSHYAAAFNRLIAVCSEWNVAVQTIKSIARRPWWGRDHTRATWYEPFEDQGDIDTAVHWVLVRPGIFLSTVGDIHLLPKMLDAASRFDSAPYDEALHKRPVLVRSVISAAWNCMKYRAAPDAQARSDAIVNLMWKGKINPDKVFDLTLAPRSGGGSARWTSRAIKTLLRP